MNLYQKLKQDIQKGVLSGEKPLRQAELAKRYQTSRIPVRDALQKLKSEGWLQTHGKCGVIVSPLRAQEIEDLYLIRMHIEPLILELAVPHISNQILGRALDILESLDEDNLTAEQSGELNWEFHSVLYAAANRKTMFDTLLHIHKQCGRYIGYHSVNLDYATTSQQEHYKLIELIKEKDIKGAQQLLANHIGESGRILVEHFSQP